MQILKSEFNFTLNLCRFCSRSITSTCNISPSKFSTCDISPCATFTYIFAILQNLLASSVIPHGSSKALWSQPLQSSTLALSLTNQLLMLLQLVWADSHWASQLTITRQPTFCSVWDLFLKALKRDCWQRPHQQLQLQLQLQSSEEDKTNKTLPDQNLI